MRILAANEFLKLKPYEFSFSGISSLNILAF